MPKIYTGMVVHVLARFKWDVYGWQVNEEVWIDASGSRLRDWWQIHWMSIVWDNKIGPDYLWQRIPGPQTYIHRQALIVKTWKTILVDKVLQYYWNHWVTLMLNMNNSYVQHKHWYHGTSNNNTEKRTYDVGIKLNTPIIILFWISSPCNYYSRIIIIHLITHTDLAL